MVSIENITITGQGPGWICVDKPFGLSVHNDPGRDLVSILAGDSQLKGSGDILAPVHRLDRETCGLILLASDRKVLSLLSEQFAKRQVKKRYRALVHGCFEPGQETGLWDTPLSKQAGGRTDPAGKGRQYPAQTRYKVLEQTTHYALLEITLLSGRKHQIRRHAKLAGHPVTGDSRYASPRALAFLKDNRQYATLGLQSCYLEFQDAGRKVCLELPRLPLEMARLIQDDDPARIL